MRATRAKGTMNDKTTGTRTTMRKKERKQRKTEERARGRGDQRDKMASALDFGGIPEEVKRKKRNTRAKRGRRQTRTDRVKP